MINPLHTQPPWFAVQYGHFLRIQSGDYYGAKDILSIEDFSEQEVKANCAVICAAPAMLKMLQEMLDRYQYGDREINAYMEDKLISVIADALNF